MRKAGDAFWQTLDVAVVRRAYRVLAVASHPDAARRSGAKAGMQDGKRFIEASRAYELLMGYLLKRTRPAAPPSGRSSRVRPGPSPSRGAGARQAGQEKKGAGARQTGQEKKGAGARQTGQEKKGTGARHAGQEKKGAGARHAGPEKRSTGGKKSEPLFYRGPVPRRKLRLAEFLYYTGRVSWQSLISAIVWQRTAQPRFGELARDLRRISTPDIARILGSRLRHEQTGQTAQRLRLLTGPEVERILRLQKARRKLIGRYFVEKESMSSAVLTGILRELYRHNARWGREGR